MEILRQHIFGKTPHDIYIVVEGDDTLSVLNSADIAVVREAFASLAIPSADIMQMLAKLQQWSGQQYAAEDLAAIVKANAMRLNEEHYNSPAVSSFTYQGFPMWTDFTNRQKLRMRLEAEKASGMTNTTIWYSGHRFDLPIAVTQQLLMAVELYASKCFDVRNQHEAAINALTDAEEIAAYDYMAGYPEQLKFE